MRTSNPALYGNMISKNKWDEPERVQKEIWFCDENAVVCKVIDQGEKQSGEEEVIARES